MAGTRAAPIKFSAQSNPGRFGGDGTSRLVNAYSEMAGEEAKTPLPIYAIDGLRPFTELPKSPIRALYALPRQALIAIAGDTVYRIVPGGGFTEIGQVPATGTPFIERNRRSTPQIGIVIDRNYFILEGTSLRSVQDPDLPPPGNIAFLDGYFIFAIDDESAGRFFVAGPDDGENITALGFGVAQSDPDRLIRVYRRKGELWLMGEFTTEVWAHTGASAQIPFERMPGAAIDRGCLAPNSVALADEKLVWVADDETVRSAERYAASIISTHAVAQDIGREPNKSMMHGFVITGRNNTFYVLSGTNFTWAYNFTNGLWHERSSHKEKRWRVSCVARWLDGWYAGDFKTGEIYRIDPDYFFEGERPIIWRMVSPIQHAGGARVQYQRLQADILPGTGVGDDDPALADPHAMLRYSDDGGQTWSNEIRGAVGRRGKARTRAMFRRLGASDGAGRVLDLSMSAGVARAFMGARGTIRPLSR